MVARVGIAHSSWVKRSLSSPKAALTESVTTKDSGVLLAVALGTLLIQVAMDALRGRSLSAVVGLVAMQVPVAWVVTRQTSAQQARAAPVAAGHQRPTLATLQACLVVVVSGFSVKGLMARLTVVVGRAGPMAAPGPLLLGVLTAAAPVASKALTL